MRSASSESSWSVLSGTAVDLMSVHRGYVSIMVQIERKTRERDRRFKEQSGAEAKCLGGAPKCGPPPLAIQRSGCTKAGSLRSGATADLFDSGWGSDNFLKRCLDDIVWVVDEQLESADVVDDLEELTPGTRGHHDFGVRCTLVAFRHVV